MYGKLCFKKYSTKVTYLLTKNYFKNVLVHTIIEINIISAHLMREKVCYDGTLYTKK